MKLHVRAFALACGVLTGLGMFIATWWLLYFGVSGEMALLSDIYRGYTVSAGGSVVGLVWGFIDGLIVGAILAYLYNKFAGED